MTDERRRAKWPITLSLGLILVTLYPLSMGPVAYVFIRNRWDDARGLAMLEAVYAPLHAVVAGDNAGWGVMRPGFGWFEDYLEFFWRHAGNP